MTNKDIKLIIDDYFGLDLCSKSRETHYIYARCIYYFCCFKYSFQEVTLSNVAKEVNIKTHGAVLNGLKAFNDFMSTNKNFALQFIDIEDIIKSNMCKKKVYKFEVIDSQKDYVLRRRVKNLEIENTKLKLKLKEWQ